MKKEARTQLDTPNFTQSEKQIRFGIICVNFETISVMGCLWYFMVLFRMIFSVQSGIFLVQFFHNSKKHSRYAMAFIHIPMMMLFREGLTRWPLIATLPVDFDQYL